MRKSAIILLAIMLVEAVPYVLMLFASPAVGIARLYSFHSTIWPAWIAAGAITVAYVAYAASSIPLVATRFFDRHPLKLIAIPFALVTGTMEELWFRKLLMDWAALRRPCHRCSLVT